MCRFRGVRQYSQGTVDRPLGAGTLLKEDPRRVTLPAYPETWNIQPNPDHVAIVLHVVAKSLLPVLQSHLECMNWERALVRNRELECRVTCGTLPAHCTLLLLAESPSDYCMTSIFNSGWLCQECGREFCEDCHASIVHLTTTSTEDDKARRMKSKTRLHPFREQNRLMYCQTGVEHYANDVLPTSRFKLLELKAIIQDMEKHALQDMEGILVNAPANLPDPAERREETDPDDPSELDRLPFHSFLADEIAEDTFRKIWATGSTVLVTGLLKRFEHEWTPATLTERYGHQRCNIVDCETDKEIETTVGNFFSKFGHRNGRSGVLKLKVCDP